MRKLAIAFLLSIATLCHAQTTVIRAVPFPQSGIPVGIAPNGTIATNGTVTLGTALPVIYPNIWLRFPASAVVSGAAGLYYATCSSTTVCAVTTTFVDPSTAAFTPYIPASTSAATGSNSTYAQTTGSQITLLNMIIPAGALGNNGSFRKTTLFAATNNANAKVVAFQFGATQVTGSQITSAATFRAQWEAHNAGVATKQLYPPGLNVPFGPATTAAAIASNDTGVAVTVLTQCQLATATDYCLVLTDMNEVFPKL